MTHLTHLIPHIEALIFASDKPLTALEITELVNNAFGFMEDKIALDQIEAAVEGIVEKYSSEFYPFEVRQSGGGWQFLTKKDYHKTVAQLNGEKFLKRLSAAALETLAIIAYKQPITKGEIETIRGVSTDYTIQKLLEKELIVISGRNEQLPGHPLIYSTSKSFMDYFGVNSADDLPKIKEIIADKLIEPTVINHTDFEQSTLSVSDDGELVDEASEVSDAANHFEVLQNEENDTSSIEETYERAEDIYNTEIGESDDSLEENEGAEPEDNPGDEESSGGNDDEITPYDDNAPREEE